MRQRRGVGFIMWYLDTRQSSMFYPTASWVCSILSQKELRTAEECFQGKKDCPSHYYLHYCFWPLSPFLSVSVSVVLYLGRLFHPSPSIFSPLPLFILHSPYCHQVRNVPVIDAHQCTASDRSRQHEKRSRWNKYICNEGKGAAKWLANLCLSKAERGPHWHIDP